MHSLFHFHSFITLNYILVRWVFSSQVWVRGGGGRLWIADPRESALFGKLDLDPDPTIKSKLWSFRDFKLSHDGQWPFTRELWRLKMKSWRVCISVVADSHHLDEELDPHESEKSDPGPHLSE